MSLMTQPVTVFFDYTCPFAWRGAEVAVSVQDELELEFTWLHFSLYQSNYRGEDQWQIWNERIDPEDESGAKGLLPFLASCAARKQGKVLHDAFRLRLLRARHRDHRSFDWDTVLDIAESAELHLAQFRDDLSNPEWRTVLAQEHHRAVEQDVFGTPTFGFGEGQLSYFRIKELPKGTKEAVELFRDYRRLLTHYPYLETVKRPRPRTN